MRITLLANRDLASCLALNYLLPGLAQHELKLFLSARVGSAEARPEPLRQLGFVEQTLFNEILFPALDAAGGDSGAELKTFSALGSQFGMPVAQLNAINSGAEFDQYCSTDPELVISIRYGVILKQPAIDLPRHGVLNLHSGLLPRYKGVMATFRALLNAEPEIGTTLHFIDSASVDAGPIVATTSMAVVAGRSYLWHVLELYRDGCRGLAQAVAQLAGGRELQASPQAGSGQYFSFPDAAALAQFGEMGLRLYDTGDLAAVIGRFLPRPQS